MDKMVELSAKDFIQNNCIDGLADMVKNNPYYAFSLLAATIEILGKCLDSSPDWHKDSPFFHPFNSAINNLDSLKKYCLKKVNIYHSLRCGLLHAGLPDNDLKLSDNKNDLHNNVIGCQELYADVKQAWQQILDDNLSKKDLSNKIFHVKNSVSGMTQTSVTTFKQGNPSNK